MTRRYLSTLLMLMLAATAAWADITGIVTGKIFDENNKPLEGATIRVVGTSRGAVSKAGGRYTVAAVPVGQQTLRVTYIGYDTATKVVMISADQTLELNFQVKLGGSKGEVVVVQADLVSKTDIGTTRKMTGGDLSKIGRDNVASAISLLPGVSAQGTGFVIRGSRGTETQVQVDGLTVTDQFNGGTGNSGATVSAAMPSPLATEEVQVMSGGFGAQYGNAVGGVIKQMVKTGRNDKFDVALRWRKDVPFLFGYANNGIQAGAPNEDVVDATLGGPIGINKSTFFVSIRNTYQNYRNTGLQVMDPAGNNLGEMPNNRTWSRNLTGRLKFQISDELSLLVGGMYGMVNGERTSWGWLYATEEGATVDKNGVPILNADGSMQLNGVPARNSQQIVVQEFTTNGFAQLAYTSGGTSYDVRFSYNGKTTETGKRKSFDAPDVISGFDLWYPEDNMAFDATTFTSGSNQILDAYDYVRAPAITKDGYASVEVTLRNPLTGYVEGPPDAQATSNPYGLLGYFVARGNEGGVDFRNAQFFQADGNLTSNIEVGETRHTFKAGFELRQLRLTRHYNSNPWDGAPFYDVYGSDYGGNLYYNELSGGTIEAKLASEKAYMPTTGALYVQDQITFKGLVFTPGLRLDYLNADANYRTSFDVFTPFGSQTGFAAVDPKLYFSPRIAVTYPISEDGTKIFNLSYGIYYMAPPFAEFYDSFNAFQLRGGQVLGNPNTGMYRSNQYQVEYSHQLDNNFAFSITGYYKDIYNQPGIAFVRVVPLPYYQRILSDYGSTRGVELTFQKRTSDNWGFNVNYTLASVRGTANDNASAPALDPYTGEPAFPVSDFNLSIDRRHRVNAILNLLWSRDEGPELFGTRFLQNFSINFSGFWQSGLPFTPVDGRGQNSGLVNSGRFPSNWNTELRIIRTIALGDIFGGNSQMDIFVDMTNIFDFTNAIAFYPRTGSPDYDGSGLNRVLGDFPSDTYFAAADPANPATYGLAQYDRMGQRKYNAAVDANRDGRVTPQESYAGYQEYVKTVIAQQNNYQYPRQVFFGVTFRF